MAGRPYFSYARFAFGWVFLGLGGFFLALNAAFKGPDTSPEGCLLSFGVVFAILGGVLLAIHPSHKREIERSQARWDEQKARLDKTWVCFRCGQEFQPD